jgi:hypothetical protein
MANRIIDQTEKVTIEGTESIPGTEQTSTGETVPKNKRWTFNTIWSWILTKINLYFLEYKKLGNITSSYTTGTALTDSSLVEVHIKVISGTPTFKIGSTSGGAEIMPETEALTENYCGVINTPCYSTTIYPRITGAGTLKVTLILRTGLF